jgi:hypothetical protein
MKKLLIIAISLFIYSQSVLSEEIKLSCDLKIEKIFGNTLDSAEKEKHEKVNEVFVITDNGKTKVISPESRNFLQITTNEIIGKSIRPIDKSSKDKWDISAVIFSESGGNYQTRYKIDRNVGKIIYKSFYYGDKYFSNTTATGICEKIDTTKKKF